MILSKFNRFFWLGSGLLLGSALAHAQSDAVLLKRATELREAPGENSRSLAALAVRTSLARSGARQGAWIQVRTTEGASGWVHMFDVGSAPTAEASGAGANALRPEPEPEPVREVEEENSMFTDDGVEGLEEGVS